MDLTPAPYDSAAFDRKVGERIKRRRLELGMSQKALGAELGVSFQQIQKYENGSTRLLVARLLEIARVLGTSIPVLLDLQDSGPTSSVPRGEVRRLLEAWNNIPSAASRRQLLRFIETLRPDTGDVVAGKGEGWNASKP